MSFLTAKIPQALADRLGANAADFSDKLTAFLDSQAADLAAAKAAPKAAEVDASLISRLSAVESHLASLKAAPAIDREALLKECRETAAAETASKLAAVLAKNGGQEIAAAASEPAASGARTFDAALAQHVAAGKSKAESLLTVIRTEPALYQAWKASGSIKI